MMALTLFLLASAAHAGVVTGARSDLDAVYAPRRVAVVIGVQDYADPKLQGLRFPTKDANDLARVLEDPEVGGFDRVVAVTGEPATTADGIEQAIARATADLQRDDTFVLYLSGHGTLTIDPGQGTRLWFLPSDARLDDPQHTGIAISWLEDTVDAVPARRRVLILDTCHDGRTGTKAALNPRTASLLAGMRGEPPAPRDLRDVSESEARLFAAQYYQPAMEDPELKNGVYTHYLIEALTTARGRADLNGDGLIDVAEAHDYARDHTISRTAGIQVPRAEFKIVGREEIYLGGNPSLRRQAEKAILCAYDQMLAKAHLLIDGVPRGVMPGLTPVEPGRHTIEVQSADGHTLVKRKVRLEAGETEAVESLVAKRQSSWFAVVGPTARTGPGAESFHRVAGEAEVGWVAPMSAVPIRWDLHARGAWMTGAVADSRGKNVEGGEIALGVAMGVDWHGFSLGPEAEAMMPWRTFGLSDGMHRQATLTGAVGGELLWTTRLGAIDLVLRADSRYAPVRYAAEWLSMWHHGIAVGFSGNR